MRALIRKAQGQHQQLRLNQSSGDLHVNLVSNVGGLLGHSSPFSEPGAGPKFVTDFDVKLNGRSVDTEGAMADNMQGDGGGTKLDMLGSSLTTSYAASPELMVTSSAASSSPLTLDSQGFGAVSTAATTTATTSASMSHSSSHGDLFSVPPERAGPLNNASLLGNVLSQAVAPQQRPQQAQPSSHPLPMTPPSQGKPNAMLMNLLNDVPQGQPMMTTGGGAAGSQSIKPRKQRKRKGTTDASSPRSTTGRSPKSSRPSEDECSKDLPTPDVESGDSAGLPFDVATGIGMPTSSGSVTSSSVPTSSSTEHSIAKHDAGLVSMSHASNCGSSDCTSSSFGSSLSSLSVPVSTAPASDVYSSGGLSMPAAATPAGKTPTPPSGDYHFKGDHVGCDTDVHAEALQASGLADAVDNFLSDDCPNSATFTVSSSSGSTIKLAASSNSDKSKETTKKVKRLKLDTSGQNRTNEERDVHLGKEIEKIPIVLDIMSAGESKSAVAAASAAAAAELTRVSDHLDRRPSVEIIPLGMAASSAHAGGLSATVHMTSAGMTMFSTSIKIAKPQALDTSNDKKDVKSKQPKEIRRTMSDTLNRKGKLDGKKDRKRKRNESVDGLDGGIKVPKIINMITSIPSSHIAGITAAADKGTVSLMSHKSLELPVSRPLTLSVKPAPASGSPNISVSVAKMPMTTFTTVPRRTTSMASPSISPTLTGSSPTKTVSILKNVQVSCRGAAYKPKMPMSSKLNPGLSTTAAAKVGSCTTNDSSSKLPEAASNTKVTISPLKVQNKSKQGLSVKNGSQSVANVGGCALTTKLPTKPATVKLKQLNLSSVSSAPSALSTARSISSPTLSKTMAVSGASSLAAGSISPVSQPSLVSNAGTPTVVTSPTSAPPVSRLQTMLSPSALTAAQKASKLLARSRKASLSSVIDKLSMQLQHTGSGELIAMEAGVPSGGNNGRKSTEGSGTPRMDGPSADRKEPKKDSQGGPFPKLGSGDLRPTKNSSLTDAKTGDAKKTFRGQEEFTVKSSLQGIKLTVTKTHSTEGGTKLSSSIKGGLATRGGGMGSIKSPSNLSKAGGSATGLKPGVNSGPASKKGVAPLGAVGPKMPNQLKSALGSSLRTSSAAVLLSSPSAPLHALSPSMLVKTTSGVVGPANSVAKMIAKHAGNIEGKLVALSNKLADKSAKPVPEGRPVTPKQQDRGLVMSGGPVISTMPPPPPPPPPTPTPEFTVQLVKRSDDPAARQTLVRQFPKLPRESLLEESEAGRAFQRLLQAQTNAGAFTKVLPSNGNGDLGGKPEGSRTPKMSADMHDRSPKSSGSDGRITPKSVLYERSGASSPNIVSGFPSKLTNQLENKRPSTPKAEPVTFRSEAGPPSSSQSPVESPLSAASSASSKGSLTPKSIGGNCAKGRQTSSPTAVKEGNSSSPEDSLVIDCPSLPPHHTPPESRNNKLPKLPLVPPPPSATDVVGASANQNAAVKSPVDVRSSASPSIQPLKSPAQPSPAVTVRSPAVASTPQSEHSNPSSVAHSSPYDIDDDLMDEALVGLGK